MDSEKRIFLISLGCAKNLVDSENILGLLKGKSFNIVSFLEEADVVIINTCGFIQSAVEESIKTIFDVLDRKKEGKIEQVFAMGCFVQRYGYKLRKEIPEVDGWLGTGDVSQIVNLIQSNSGEISPFIIKRPTALIDHTTPRIQTTPFYSSYLKVAEGCSHRCSYCTIPALRGPFRSRELESLVIEAKAMIERGVKEINLIAQDTTNYGKDLYGKQTLPDLLEKLLVIRGIRWIRILYFHPSGISKRLLELMESEEAICPYLDLPLQHINTSILRSMGRDMESQDLWQLIEHVKSLDRDLSLRTTLMIGFPGETDAIFQELYHFVATVEFDHLGAFIFSPEKGTPAAKMGNIPEEGIVKSRLDAIMDLQARISEKKNRELVGRTVPVLIEGISQETDLLLSGRMVTMAPDVDSRVLINKGQGVEGEIMSVRINEAHPYDLIGEIVLS